MRVFLAACRHILCILMFVLVVIGPSASAFDNSGEGLLIGVEPEHNIFEQIERYRILAEYLSKELGINVRLTVMSRYGELLKRFKSRRLDGAFLSSYTAAMAFKQLNLEPVAMAVNLKDNAFSQGYLFTRKDSGITAAKEMQGKSIVFVDPATTEGYLFPLVWLRQNGVKDKERYFSRFSFSGSHASAIFAVLDGKADIGCAKSTVYNRQITKDPTIGAELRIIAESAAVPETTLCLKKDIPGEVKQKLLAILEKMTSTERGRSVLHNIELLRFVKAGDSDFDGIAKMIEIVEKP